MCINKIEQEHLVWHSQSTRFSKMQKIYIGKKRCFILAHSWYKTTDKCSGLRASAWTSTSPPGPSTQSLPPPSVPAGLRWTEDEADTERRHCEKKKKKVKNLKLLNY